MDQCRAIYDLLTAVFGRHIFASWKQEIEAKLSVSLQNDEFLRLIDFPLIMGGRDGHTPGWTIRQALKTLSPRQRRILIMRFGFGGRKFSFSEIGKEFNITRERARIVVRMSLYSLRRQNRNALLCLYYTPTQEDLGALAARTDLYKRLRAAGTGWKPAECLEVASTLKRNQLKSAFRALEERRSEAIAELYAQARNIPIPRCPCGKAVLPNRQYCSAECRQFAFLTCSCGCGEIIKKKRSQYNQRIKLGKTKFFKDRSHFFSRYSRSR